MMQCLLGVLTLGKTRLWARKRVCLRENTLPRLNLFYVNGVTMSHNTLPTVTELSGEMRERLAKVKYVFTDLDATMLARSEEHTSELQSQR